MANLNAWFIVHVSEDENGRKIKFSGKGHHTKTQQQYAKHYVCTTPEELWEAFTSEPLWCNWFSPQREKQTKAKVKKQIQNLSLDDLLNEGDLEL